jgi:hypothetical protein
LIEENRGGQQGWAINRKTGLAAGLVGHMYIHTVPERYLRHPFRGRFFIDKYGD